MKSINNKKIFDANGKKMFFLIIILMLFVEQTFSYDHAIVLDPQECKILEIIETNLYSLYDDPVENYRIEITQKDNYYSLKRILLNDTLIIPYSEYINVVVMDSNTNVILCNKSFFLAMKKTNKYYEEYTQLKNELTQSHSSVLDILKALAPLLIIALVLIFLILLYSIKSKNKKIMQKSKK